jgi:hypothetical protein
MATRAQMDRLVGKALFDGDFRKQLIDDPEKAARSLRYRLDPAQAARIRSLSADELASLAAAFASATDIDKPRDGISFW